MSEKKINVNVRLEDETLRKFLEIKKAKGMHNNGEVVRLIIHEYWVTLEE